MNEIDEYVSAVMTSIHAAPQDRQRIEGDLRSHMREAVDSGEPIPDILRRMGAPTEVAAGFMSEMALKYAGFVPRAAAFAIDMLIIIPLMAVMAILGATFGNMAPDHPEGLELATGGLLIGLAVLFTVSAIGLMAMYFPILEGRFGRTPGKRLLHLRVLKENGLPIGYKEALLRRLSFYFDFWLPDALFIPFTQKKQRALDIVARTIVIRNTD